jgi:DNA-binding FadR family transcriptional regulator
VDWHLAVAEASHNELLTGFMLALSRVIYTATDNQAFVDAEVRRTTIRAHARVTEAIEAGDAEAALRRMTRHLYKYTEAISEVEDRTAIEVPED